MFFILGLSFTVPGLIQFIRFDPDAHDVQTTGIIVAIEERGSGEDLRHDVFIDYTAGGQKFKHAE